MLVLSEYAASLTGSLAMLDAEERPVLALSVSESLHRILEREARDTQLVGVVEGLADSLERYAGGDRAALAEVQVYSARNAQLRTHYQLCMAQEKNRDE
jgi:hypothetical protein